MSNAAPEGFTQLRSTAANTAGCTPPQPTLFGPRGRRYLATSWCLWTRSAFRRAPLLFSFQAHQLTNLGQAAKNRFAKSGQMLSGGNGGPAGFASIFIRNGT